jgi:hypothetical protein
MSASIHPLLPVRRPPGSLTIRRKCLEVIDLLNRELRGTIRGGGAIEYTTEYIGLIDLLKTIRLMIERKIPRYSSCIDSLNQFSILFAEVSGDEEQLDYNVYNDSILVTTEIPKIIMYLTTLRSNYYRKTVQRRGENQDEYLSE